MSVKDREYVVLKLYCSIIASV